MVHSWCQAGQIWVRTDLAWPLIHCNMDCRTRRPHTWALYVLSVLLHVLRTSVKCKTPGESKKVMSLNLPPRKRWRILIVRTLNYMPSPAIEIAATEPVAKQEITVVFLRK